MQGARRSRTAQEEASELLEEDTSLEDDLDIVRKAVDISINAASRKRILHHLSPDLKLSFSDVKNFFQILQSIKTLYTSPTSCLDVKLKMLEQADSVIRGNDIKLLLDAAKKAGFSPILGSEGHAGLRAKFDSSLGWNNPKDRGVFSSVADHVIRDVKQGKIPPNISLIDMPIRLPRISLPYPSSVTATSCWEPHHVHHLQFRPSLAQTSLATSSEGGCQDDALIRARRPRSAYPQ